MYFNMHPFLHDTRWKNTQKIPHQYQFCRMISNIKTINGVELLRPNYAITNMWVTFINIMNCKMPRVVEYFWFNLDVRNRDP